jgi:hypothetical protein
MLTRIPKEMLVQNTATHSRTLYDVGLAGPVLSLKFAPGEVKPIPVDVWRRKRRTTWLKTWRPDCAAWPVEAAECAEEAPKKAAQAKPKRKAKPRSKPKEKKTK